MGSLLAWSVSFTGASKQSMAALLQLPAPPPPSSSEKSSLQLWTTLASCLLELGWPLAPASPARPHLARAAPSSIAFRPSPPLERPERPVFALAPKPAGGAAVSVAEREVVKRTVCLPFLFLGSQDVGTSGPQLPSPTMPLKAPAVDLNSRTLTWASSATSSTAQALL